MILHHPFFITSRLLPGVRISDAVISLAGIEYGDRDNAEFLFDFNSGDSYSDKELRSGAQGFRSSVEVFETFLTFLSACAESMNYTRRDGEPGENANLFPRRIAQWAAENSTEIEDVLCQLQDENGRVLHNLIDEGQNSLS